MAGVGLVNEINHAYFSRLSPLVKSDGDVIQEASRRRHGSIEKCSNVWRMMKTADSEEKKLRKNSVNTAVKKAPEV